MQSLDSDKSTDFSQLSYSFLTLTSSLFLTVPHSVENPISQLPLGRLICHFPQIVYDGGSRHGLCIERRKFTEFAKVLESFLLQRNFELLQTRWKCYLLQKKSMQRL